MNYFMPTRLFTGKECLGKHANMLEALGKTCFLVTDRTAARASGALDDVVRALDGAAIAHQLWDGVTENPPVASCIEAGRLASQQGAQFILGIGGGSSLDAAKAIAVFAANPDLNEREFYAFAWKHAPLPIVLVGTTAGTGSEVTKVSVLTDEHARKHSIHDDRLYATLAFGDSRHTHSCPQGVTLSCGVDVLAHATESYFSHKADDISRAFAVRAIRLALGPLEAASAQASLNEEQRRALYDASILGGLAINTTGTCFPHNVGYFLTENYRVPHGFASAVFMPAMLELANDYDHAYAQAFYDEIGTDATTYYTLVKKCIPTYTFSLSEAQVDEALPRWESNGSVMNTRAQVSCATIRKILLSTFAQS